MAFKMEQEKRVSAEREVKRLAEKCDRSLDELRSAFEFISQTKTQFEEIEMELLDIKDSKKLQARMVYMVKEEDEEDQEA